VFELSSNWSFSISYLQGLLSGHAHKTAHNHHKDLLRFQDLDEMDQQLIKLWTVILADIESVYLHNLKHLIDKFESL